MKKYRWLNDYEDVEYRGRANPGLKGKRGSCVILPKPGYIGNVLVQFNDGSLVVCPAGTLRMVNRNA